MLTCQGVNKDGQPCKAPASKDTGWCTFHNPALAEKRQQAKSRGGRARQGRKLDPVMSELVPSIAAVSDDPLTLEELARVISAGIRTATTMEKSHAQLRTLGYLADKMIKLYELTTLAERLDRIEDLLSRQPGMETLSRRIADEQQIVEGMIDER